MLIKRRSLLTGKENVMDIPVDPNRLNDYLNGNELIQNAFPELTEDEREFILTGSTSTEWEELKAEDE